MKVVGLILIGICVSLQNQMPGGEVIVSERKFANLDKDDPNFGVLKKYTNLVLNRNCKIQVDKTISVRYHVVEGINYTAIFSTSFGPVKIVALTVLWIKSISVSEISFTDLGSIEQVDPEIQDFSVSDILLKQYQQLLAKNDEKYQIPKLKKLCEKISNNKSNESLKLSASKATGVNAPRNLQEVSQPAEMVVKQHHSNSWSIQVS